MLGPVLLLSRCFGCNRVPYLTTDVDVLKCYFIKYSSTKYSSAITYHLLGSRSGNLFHREIGFYHAQTNVEEQVSSAKPMALVKVAILV